MFLISQIVDYKLLPNYHCYFGSFPIDCTSCLSIIILPGEDGAGQLNIWKLNDSVRTKTRLLHYFSFHFIGQNYSHVHIQIQWSGDLLSLCPESEKCILVNISNIFNRYDLVANKNLFNFFLVYFFFQFLSIASKRFVFGVSSPSSMSVHFGRP